jgi:hypothetical protein
MRKQDNYLNPEMRAYAKKRKKDIPYVDLTDENFRDCRGKDIPHSDRDSSADESCTHLAFLSPAPKFGDETGDEDYFDENGQFIIPKIEPPEHPDGRTEERQARLLSRDGLPDNNMPPTEDETSSSGSNRGESSHEDATKIEDLLQSDTLPLHQGEGGGIGLTTESEEKPGTKSTAQTPSTGQIPAPDTPQIADEIRDPSPGSSTGIVRRTPVQETDQQSTSSILVNNTIDDGGWDPLLDTVVVAEENRNVDQMVLDGIRKALVNLDRVLPLGIDWGKVFVPTGNKGKGKGKSSTKRQVAATQEPTASGQLTAHKENTENARTKGRPEDTTAEIERRRPGEEREEEEEIQPVPNPPNDIESDQEVEISAETDKHEKIGLNFPPLNPENLEEEKGLSYYLPLQTSTPIRRHNSNEEENKLWIVDLPTEFPLLHNSMEGARTGNHVVGIHLELGAYGYELVKGDIIQCSPLGNQARGQSKIPIVVTYKNKDTKVNVTKAAKDAGLRQWRVTKGEDKSQARRGYFKAPITGRHKHTPCPSRQKKDTHPKRSQRKNRKMSNQTKPPSAKVDNTEQKDTQKPAKTKAKKDGEPNITVNRNEISATKTV